MRAAAVLVATLSMAACGGGSKNPGPGPGWTLVDTTMRYGIDIIAVGSRLVASGDAPIVVSDDDGVTWKLSNAGLPLSTPAFDLVARGSILVDTSAGLYESRDNGASWSSVAALGLPTTFSIFTSLVVGTDILVGLNAPSTDVGTSGALFRTSDEGVTFDPSSAGLPQDQGINAFASAGVIYCAVSSGVGKSTDNGATWVLSPLPTTGNVFSVVAVGGTVLAGTDAGSLYTSPDGASWSLAGAGLPPGGSIDVLFTDALFPDAGKAYASGTDGGGVNPFGVYVSSDAGATWTALNDGFDTALPYVVAFAAKDGFLFAVTVGDGIWRRPL